MGSGETSQAAGSRSAGTVRFASPLVTTSTRLSQTNSAPELEPGPSTIPDTTGLDTSKETRASKRRGKSRALQQVA
jgi:hypothetical protein